MRENGTIERFPLSGEWTGYSLGIEHRGPGLILEWQRKGEAIKYREPARIRKMRAEAGLTEADRELCPKLWPSSFESMEIVSPEGIEEARQLYFEAIGRSVRFVERNGFDMGWDSARIRDEIDRWAIEAETFLAIISIQSLSATDPLVESDREPPTGGPSVGGGHSGGGG